MKKERKNGQMWKIALVFVAVFAWVVLPFLMQKKVSANGDEMPILVRTANLVAPSGSVNPHGMAEYQLYQSGNRELEIEIEDVNLADGTVLDFFVDGNSVGQKTLSMQSAKLKLNTELGDTVPVTTDGSTVQVKNGSTILVAGVLNGGGPNPTPSPSGSPTGSPTVSPSGSPTGTPTGSPSPSPSGSPNESEIYAILNGATINGVLPRGYAEYEVEGTDREFEIRVRQVNLPVGTVLAVFVDNISAGNMTLQSDGEGELELETDDGQTVPMVIPGSTVAVKNGDATILSGTFSGSPNPSPTPTGTPQGRRFEGHLNGAGVTPPVTTNGRGEIKVLLNADETQATITGEYEDLSSAQTSAKIMVTVANNTTVVADLGVFGGTERHFPALTINVTAQQVQQLRTGMWFAVIGSQNHTSGEIQGTILNDSDNSDFDGDGSNDFSVYRPTTGVWYSQNSAGFTAQTFGGAGDIPVSADYDGDGRTDSAVFRNVNGSGIWEIKRSSDGGVTATQFGLSTDVPVRGDFDGDGRNDYAVFRPSTGVWYVQKSNNTGFIIVQFGTNGDKAMASDFDGDGRDDIVIFRPSTGVWYWIRSSNGAIGIVQFGTNGDVPLKGDFDGDGREDISVWRPSTGVWYIWKSSDNGFDIRQFGLNGDVPVAGNYDGDTKTDIGIFRPSTGIWYIWRSVDNTFEYRQFGLSGDIPTVAQ